MYFIIIDNLKLIIFWSPKCGCSTLKNILARYLNIYNNKYEHIHINRELNQIINKKNINKMSLYKTYDIVMLIRNPYHRLVSGFLNKYVLGPEFSKPDKCNNFKDFCSILSKYPEKIDRHHFSIQTSGKGWKFYIDLKMPKIKYVLDTSQVTDIIKILNFPNEQLENLKKKYNGVTYKNKKFNRESDKIWSIKLEDLKKYNKQNISKFYNEDLKQKIYIVYKNDFEFFNNILNMNYDIDIL